LAFLKFIILGLKVGKKEERGKGYLLQLSIASSFSWSDKIRSGTLALAKLNTIFAKANKNQSITLQLKL
jgi:hypothetical protein